MLGMFSENLPESPERSLPPIITSFDSDPFLQYRPPFVRSLPVQILLTGIVLALVAVLLVHLIFAAHYHWHLTPVNYVLQLTGVTTLFISLVSTLHVILASTYDESVQWPYMLSYLAVNVPGCNWTSAERAAWLTMYATTSGLIQASRYREVYPLLPLIIYRSHTFNSSLFSSPRTLKLGLSSFSLVSPLK